MEWGDRRRLVPLARQRRLKALEIGRRVTASTLRAVTAHPAMRDLPEQAQRQGLDLNTFLNSADPSATRGKP